MQIQRSDCLTGHLFFKGRGPSLSISYYIFYYLFKGFIYSLSERGEERERETLMCE